MKVYSLNDKVKAAKEMVKVFRPERIAFLIVSIISVLTLIVLSVYAFLQGEIGWEIFAAMFLPAGGITYSASLILGMFTKTLEFLKDELK